MCIILRVSYAGILEDRDEKNKGGALFLREHGRTASYYASRSFEPIFESTPELIIPSNHTEDIKKANELCGDSYQCKYDYAVSLNRDLAFYTLQYQDGYVNTKKTNQHRGIVQTRPGIFGSRPQWLFYGGRIVHPPSYIAFHVEKNILFCMPT